MRKSFLCVVALLFSLGLTAPQFAQGATIVATGEQAPTVSSEVVHAVANFLSSQGIMEYQTAVAAYQNGELQITLLEGNTYRVTMPGGGLTITILVTEL